MFKEKTMYLSKECKEKIVSFLKEKFHPAFIYLFGSFAKGEGREDSDVDLAIYVPEKVRVYDLFLGANELAGEIHRDAEIIDLKEISTVFAAQIVGTKEVLYCEDESLMAYYDIRALKDYAKLNEERKIVLDAIERDSRIYGP